MKRWSIILITGIFFILSIIYVTARPIPYGSYTYDYDDNGYFEVYRNGEITTRLAFAITGTYNGENYIYSSNDFVWDWNKIGTVYYGTNNHVFDWDIEVNVNNNRAKFKLKPKSKKKINFVSDYKKRISKMFL